VGQGGMATVYLAEDLKHGRRVAVKVLRPELAAALGHERFVREIGIAAQLQHPHILPLFDSGEAEGFLYYVMPFVEGESLRERLTRDGSIPIHEAVRIIREVVDALAHAHQHGIVHRDIKPDNVMLSGRHATVTDFGVAKAVSAAGSDKLTTVGMALGTPTYMSPEQAMGETDLDARADIYSVGALAYELLSGHPPFEGRLTIVSATGGAPRTVPTGEGYSLQGQWSPDGHRIAFIRYQKQADLGVVNADGTGLRMLTDDAALEFTPEWSPDGTLIALRTKRAGNWDVAVVDEKTGEMRVLTTPQSSDYLEDWTPDGKALLMTSADFSHKLVTVRVDALLPKTP
jgi:serine/threonine protein kinase